MEEWKPSLKQDPRTTEELFKLAISAEDDEEFHNPVLILWDRHAQEVADTARLMCHSDVADERAVGAYVLSGNTSGRISWGVASVDQTSDMVNLFIDMLNDEDPNVLEAVLVSLGMLSWGHDTNSDIRRKVVKTIPRVLSLADHPDASLRRVVANALSSLDRSTKSKRLLHSMESALVKLTWDEDEEVRPQAVLNLTCEEKWSTEVRQTLYNHLDDKNADVRALVLDELAERAEPGVVDLLIKEMCTYDVVNATFVLGAAKKLADSQLLPHLQDFKNQRVGDWYYEIEAAIEACTIGKNIL
ncbi:MAG: hypothetical protein ACYC0V_10970 [Armatimonadota bacterium]